MAAPVMSHDSIPLPEEVEQLGVPVIGTQWPAMMEDEGLRVLGAPVLVEDRDPILRGNCAHRSLLRMAESADIRDCAIDFRSLSRLAINSARHRSSKAPSIAITVRVANGAFIHRP